VWDLALSVGHGLGAEDRLAIGRTSSQDTGLDDRAQVVVATASLEVGVDDDRVGAVIQHKSPRDMAAFLQRKGRAGRGRGSRPLTVVVLSDYGRDRETYEAWDQLLSPALRPMNLPVGNVHVLRMQATQAMIEWAARRAGSSVRGQALWTTLAGPRSYRRDLDAQAAIARELQHAVESAEVRETLAAYLVRALGLERPAVDDLLWQAPRPVLLAAAPALIRRVKDDWQRAGGKAREDAGARQPLPDFIPATLFSPLALPEVAVALPAWHERRRRDAEPLMMGVVQSLRELAPGRVTKRFAVDSDLDRAWVPVTDLHSGLEISRFVTAYQSEGTIGEEQVPLLRPLSIQTEQPDRRLRDSSNGHPVWRTEIRPTGSGVDLRVIPNDPLGGLIGGLQAHLHRDQCNVEVARGMVGSEVSLVFEDGSREQGQVGLVHAESPVALGAVHDVDGLLVEVAVDITGDLWTGRLGPQLRRARFLDRVSSDRSIRERVGPFAAGLVHDAVLTGILHRAVRDGVDLARAWEGFSAQVDESIETILHILLATEVPGDGGSERGAGGRVEEAVNEALRDPEVLDLVGAMVPCLWEEADDEDLEWLRLRAVRTIGELLLGGARLLCPDQDPEGIVIDVEPEGSRPGHVWLTEATIGGGGFLEAVVDAAAAEPSRLLRLARAALRPGVGSLISTSLTDLVQELGANEELTTGFARYRDAERTTERVNSIDAIAASLQGLGITATPDIMGSVVNRLLRPGSDPRTDEIVRSSLASWIGEEDRLGLEIPLRTWCFLDASREGPLDERKLDDLQLLLWPRGSAPRDAQLTSYSPFNLAPPPSAALAEQLLLIPDVPSVDFSDLESTWEAVSGALREGGVCRVRAAARDQEDLLLFLAHTTTNPVELDWLRLYSRVAVFERDSDGNLWVELDLPEVRA
jgi:hypothetical protein